ncbi:hypothetical protein HYW67_03980 [Candidatus Parcubacteria bacterium]|nr:hypothetical protein [Candidatus Parcubacteria bacterium]
MPYESPHQLESEILELEQRLEERRRTLAEAGQTPPEGHEKGTIREYVAEQIDKSVRQSATPPTPQPQTAPPPSITVPTEEESVKVQEFVNTAFLKGLPAAVSTIKATHNARLVDAFHDALVDHLYQDLVQRGKLKPM